jgi:carbamoyl-phosphate synthase large subunit
MTNPLILVLGSGPIRIGQAAEFDYSGSQACRALKEEGYRIVLLNSNPATIQTDQTMADYVYLKPLTPDVVESILDTHRPQGVIATLGGQTALNLCVKCQELGIWEKYGTRILGTSVEAIQRAEGREAFRQAMIDIGQPVVPSTCVSTYEEAEQFCTEDMYPYIIRPDFTLGGSGGGVARDPSQLKERVLEGIRVSPANRVLVERYLEGWGEVEAEVVRDSDGNSLCVCSMENVDPMGIHTGDSIVVSPVLTLTDREWQRLRKAALEIVESIEVEGACNVQFAISPDRQEYAIIEVNPRASRSSALASKATGYPIARMAARIALGRKLAELPNPVTGTGSAMSEPALDYVVVKMPRWPFDSFPQADPGLGTKMKATGEVLAIGTSFPQALMKAFRSLDGHDRVNDPHVLNLKTESLWEETERPTHRRIPAMMELLRRGIDIKALTARSGIHPYFIAQLDNIIRMEKRFIQNEGIPGPEMVREAKNLGFSDSHIAFVAGTKPSEIFAVRKAGNIYPGYREVDGCAGEIPAGSGYFYSSYGTPGDPFTPEERKGVAVIGSGAIRIAQGVEFDYCCVKAVEALRRRNYRAVMINNNPETVSTDHDISDALYVDPISEEDVRDILKREKITGILPGFGGQTSLKAGQELDSPDISVLGTSCDAVDATEDRGRFASILDRLGIDYPSGRNVSSSEEAFELAEQLGFPLMVRPNFVIGGVAMHVINHMDEFRTIISKAFELEPDQIVLVDRFLPGKEFEVDAVCDGETVLIPGIFEHLDPAGVHSGDSITIFPDISLFEKHRQRILEIVQKISSELKLKGLLNVQFVMNEGTIYTIEANPRASRTIPIVSKLTGVPMVDLAVGTALGEKLSDIAHQTGLLNYDGPFGVKMPVFSTEKLPGIDHKLGPQMQSTGEALGVHETVSVALWDAIRGSDWEIPPKGKILISVRDDKKSDASNLAAAFHALGWELEATPGTAAVIEKWNLPVKSVDKGQNLLMEIRNRRWDLIVNMPGLKIGNVREGYDIRRAAIEEGIPCLHSLEAAIALSIVILTRQN